MPIGVDDVVELLATTSTKYGKNLQDQVQTEHQVLSLLGAPETFTGTHWQLPLLGAHQDTTKVTTDDGSFTTDTDKELIGAAIYDVRQPIVSSSVLNWKALQQNAGQEQLISLIKAHTEGAVADHKRKLSQWIHALHANRPAGAFDSFDTLFSHTLPTGGINPREGEVKDVNGVITTESSKAFWRAQSYEVSSADMSVGKAIRFLKHRIEKYALNSPDVCLVGLNLWEALQDELDGKVVYNLGSGDKGKIAFDEFSYAGLTIRYDKDAPANRCYMFARKAIKWAAVNGNFLSVQPKQSVVGRVAGAQTLNTVVPWVSLLIMGTDSRRDLGKFDYFFDGTPRNPHAQDEAQNNGRP